MKVIFKSDWFGPGGRRYRKANNPNTVDEAFRDQLPSTAEVLKETVEEEKTPPVTTPATKIKI